MLQKLNLGGSMCSIGKMDRKQNKVESNIELDCLVSWFLSLTSHAIPHLYK